MLVLFVATQWNQMLENFVRSLRKNHFTFKQLGTNKKWKNFKFKSELVYNELQNNDDLVIVSDSYDVIVNRNATGLKKTFESYKKPILVGSEWYCGSKKNCQSLSNYWSTQEYVPPKKYANAGFIMGISKELKKLYKSLLLYDDDQFGLSSYINENPSLFALDHANHIVQNVHVLDTVICEPWFYHFPGPMLKYGLFPQYNNVARKVLQENSLSVYPHEYIYFFAFIAFFAIIFVFNK